MESLPIAVIVVALIEISLGVVAGNFLGLTSPPWMDFPPMA
jgi:hypothetical protein